MAVSTLARVALALGFACVASDLADAQTHVAGWGYQVFDSRLNEGIYTDVSAGVGHTLALRTDGTVAAWGGNWAGQYLVQIGRAHV